MMECNHDKTSFVFYNDWIATYYNLPPEMRLELMDMIFAYHLTRENQTTDNLALKVAYGLIEPAMARDITSFYESKERRRASGSKGGQARASNAKQSQAMLSNAKQSQAIQAVNVNVNDNVNVKVNGNVNVNDDVMEVLNASPTKVEALQRLHKLQTSEIYEYAKQFQAHIDFVGEPHKGQADLLKHFRDWLKYRINEENKNKNDTNDNPSYEQRAEGAARLVAKCLAACDAEVRGEGQLPTHIQPF